MKILIRERGKERGMRGKTVDKDKKREGTKINERERERERKKH